MESKIPGVTQKRLDRIIMHLKKAQEITGKTCVKRRGVLTHCPMRNFAPYKEANGFYEWPDCRNIPYVLYELYSEADTYWWNQLEDGVRRLITHWIERQIKEGKLND